MLRHAAAAVVTMHATRALLRCLMLRRLFHAAAVIADAALDAAAMLPALICRR